VTLQRSALVGLILLGAARAAVGQPLEPAEQSGPAKSAVYSEVGWASWYGREFHGRRTANGETFDMGAITAAHKTLPLPCYARVTNLRNGRSIVVRVNDRGPYVSERLIDVSARVADLLDFQSSGLTRVKVDYLSMAPLGGGDEPTLLASLTTPGSSDAGVSAYAQTPPVKTAFAQSGALAAANQAANGLARSLGLIAPAPRETPSPLSPYGALVPSVYGDLIPWPAEPAVSPALMAAARP
jgi:rare lipoprotein A